MKLSFIRHSLFVSLFIVFLWLPLMHWVVPLFPEYRFFENRKLANPPQFSQSLYISKKTILEIQDYFRDHFGLRTSLIHYYNQLSRGIFGIHKQVMFGDEDWLFLRKGVHQDVSNPIPINYDLCGYSGFEAEELERWVNALVNNWRTLRTKGISYHVVIVPNKHTIYSQYVPLPIPCSPGKSRMSVLRERLQAIPGFPWIEVSEALLKEAGKGDQKLYYLTDTHWNAHGVITAYKSIVNQLQNDYPIYNAAGQARILEKEGYVGDLALMLQEPNSSHADYQEVQHRIQFSEPTARVIDEPSLGVYHNKKQNPATWRSTHTNGIRALILHDSFFYKNMQSLLAESFEETTFLWRGGLLQIEQQPIEIVQPNLVIHEMVERGLMNPVLWQ